MNTVMYLETVLHLKSKQAIKKLWQLRISPSKRQEFIVDNPSYAKITTYNKFSLLNILNNFSQLLKPKPNFQFQNPTSRKPIFQTTINSQVLD